MPRATKHLLQKQEYAKLCERIATRENELRRMQGECKRNASMHQLNEVRALTARIARMRTHHHPGPGMG